MDQRARPKPCQRRSQRGLTLTELLATMSVALVGLSLAVPNVIGLTGDRVVTGAVDRLTADMTLARSEAIRRGGAVIVCSSDDGATCSGSTDWEGGWVLYAEPEAGGAGHELIRVAPAVAGGLRLGASHAKVVYRADGSSTAL